MLMLPASTRLYLCTEPCDMRRGFDGLLAEAKRRCQADPFAGHLFIFLGKRRHHLKVLFWQSGGLCIFAKRLEIGSFRLPKIEPGQASLQLAAVDLAMLLDGIDLRQVRRQKLHEPTGPVATI
ncbi:MAG: transposase [Myxococcales bacterium]|nr:transposase [Myxococcales bacterium]